MSGFGIVLGAGGVLGGAWNVGALHALSVSRGIDPRDAAALVGTSAGAVSAALLSGGISVALMLDHHRGLPMPEGVVVEWDHDTGTGGARPARPRLRPGSPRLLAHAVRHPGQVAWTAALFAALPRGGGDLSALRRAIESAVPAGSWAPRDGVRIVVTDFLTGQRVALGAPGAPAVSLADAVVASCSAPAWYPPQVLHGRPYVDGGVVSAVSADLLVGVALDEVFVLAPLAALTPDIPSNRIDQIERRWRRRTTRRVLAETRALRASGTRVTLLTPGPQELAIMGANMMNPSRRAAVLEASALANLLRLKQTAVEQETW